MAQEERRLHMLTDLTKLSEGELCWTYGAILTRPGIDWPTPQEQAEMAAINAEYERRRAIHERKSA